MNNTFRPAFSPCAVYRNFSSQDLQAQPRQLRDAATMVLSGMDMSIMLSIATCITLTLCSPLDVSGSTLTSSTHLCSQKRLGMLWDLIMINSGLAACRKQQCVGEAMSVRTCREDQ